MYDNLFNRGAENFFGPSWVLGMSLLGGVFILVILVSLALKGIALWHAAKRDEKWWFVALLLINTLGILELVYLIFFAKVSFHKKCCKGGKCDTGDCKHENCNCGDCEKCVAKPRPQTDAD